MKHVLPCWFLAFAFAIHGVISVLPDLHIAADYLDVNGQSDINSFSTILEFSDADIVDGLTDDDLIGLAKLGYDQMTLLNLPNPRRGRPGAMIAWAWRNFIFFSSSWTGERELFLDSPDPYGKWADIRKFLQLCADATGKNNHVRNGRCGEPSVVDLAYRVALQPPTTGRVVAWGGPQRVVFPPCGDTRYRYGCNTMLREMMPNVEGIRRGNPSDNVRLEQLGGLFSPIVPKNWRIGRDCELGR